MENKKSIENYFYENKIDLEKVIEENTSYLIKTIQNISNNILTQEDIEEIILDTFFALWKKENELELNRPILPYLVGIAKNITKKKLRKLKIELDIEEYDNVLFNDKQLLEIIETREKNEILYETINKMQKTDIQIFLLYYHNNKGTKEIAEHMKMKDFNVRSRLHRIRKKLQKEMEGKGYGK
ncbi:MAG: sigma-70 family RNA polymerase sigma factor [Clostridia bacterium]|nr:sigma-70 family RNA polymerase sigma factor [Clostridia bacterium]